MKFIWNNIILGIVVNLFVAPIAYAFRKRAQEKKNWLWNFLSDDNMYGDEEWKPAILGVIPVPNTPFWRAYLWMMRNPRQNWYWKDYVYGVEYGFKGSVKYKINCDPLYWRTVRCLDTSNGNQHGKLIDWDNNILGYQDITFSRNNSNGEVQECYRKSKCIPHRFFKWIMFSKSREGHEDGLLQYNFSFPLYPYKENAEGFKKWKKEKWAIKYIN